jgi:hypothetical protein
MKRTLKRESKGLEVVKREWKWGREMRKGVVQVKVLRW